MKRPRFITPRIILGVLALAGVLAAGYSLTPGGRRERSGGEYLTAEVTKGRFDVVISATGTLQPEETVDVGAQVGGKIISFGLDTSGKPIDYRSAVRQGGVLAQIDDALYRSDLELAEAQLKRAQAGLAQSVAKRQQGARDWERAKRLGPSTALSETSYDAYQAAYETAQALVADAEAQVSQARASLARAERNLGYCTITSPVDGIIIDRRVNIGQTVNASLNAPSLFLIAKDLSRMQVWASVNEADIGQVTPGQRATFTVDAFPGSVFEGRVLKTRLNASMTQNVVTYLVELQTDNADGKLLPYLTANVRFEVYHSDSSLLVPTAALRWSPPEAERSRTAHDTETSSQGAVWVLDPSAGNGMPQRVAVQVGRSDGTRAELLGDAVRDGTTVVTGYIPSSSASGAKETRNPFAPQIPRGSRRQ